MKIHRRADRFNKYATEEEVLDPTRAARITVYDIRHSLAALRRDQMKVIAIWGGVLSLAAISSRSQNLNADLQEKLAAVRESVVKNQASLRGYSWTEHTAVSYKGELKKTKDEICRYGPDGQVQKTEIGASPPPKERHGIRGRVAEKKIDEMKDYMEQAIILIHQYVPPFPPRMDAAFQAGNVSIGRSEPGVIQVRFTNYVKPGDLLVFTFNQAARTLSNINVNTYMQDAQDAVKLAVTFNKLPDRTNYAATTVLDAPKKEIQVTNTNSNYQKISIGQRQILPLGEFAKIQ
jgi:hypothetical protein